MKMIFTIFCLHHFLFQGLIFNRKTKFLAPLSKTKKFQHSKKSITESRDFGTVYFFRTVCSRAPVVSFYQNWFKPVYGPFRQRETCTVHSISAKIRQGKNQMYQ